MGNITDNENYEEMVDFMRADLESGMKLSKAIDSVRGRMKEAGKDFDLEFAKYVRQKPNKVMRWETYLEEHSLPYNGVIDIRVSDDVLDEGDWRIDTLVIKEGVVVSQVTILDHGAYALGDMVGKTIKELAKWSSYNGAGSHPENFHEIRIVVP